jgi:D-glycero-D-manno-heptose 1,7-bisphosphate phosphatase
MAMSGSGMPAVFLDKDGTLIENVPYNVDPALVRLVPDVGEALRLLADAGFALVIVTNQSGVARGMFEVTALDELGATFEAIFEAERVKLAGWYWCPHFPDGAVSQYAVTCECRKPAPGLLVTAARDLAIDLELSWLIGDILDDVEAGNRAGCRTVLLDVGSETEWRSGPHRTPHHQARTLLAAARHIAATVEAERPRPDNAGALR